MKWQFTGSGLLAARGWGPVIAGVGAIVAAGPMAWARDVVDITADVGAEGLIGDFEAGAMVPIRFFVASGSSAPLYGVDFEVMAISEDIRIASVTQQPLFAEAAGPNRASDARDRYRGAWMQSRAAFDHGLGTDGRALHFATVEVEVLSDRRFESGLIVRAMGALLGRAPTATRVLGADRGRRGYGQGILHIANTHRAVVPSGPTWDTAVGQLSFELRPVGESTAAVDLLADTTYEVHYWADTPAVIGYALYGISDSANQSLSAAAPPGRGDWSGGEYFVFAETTVQDGLRSADHWEQGDYYRFDVIGDDLWPCEIICAAPTGHVCNVTTNGPGTLVLQLIMFQDDTEARQSIEMQAEAVYDVYAQGR